MSHSRLTPLALAIGLLCSAAQAQTAAPSSASGASATDAALQALRQQLDALKQQYDARIRALENQLQQAQAQGAVASRPDASADADAALPATQTTSSGLGQESNRFNPAVSLILSGGYAGLSKDPETWRLKGFVPGGEELGPGKRGFSLSETELRLSANIDHLFYGAATLAVSPEDTVSVEEAFVQTMALPAGLTLKAGRFFAGLGYLNEQHAHTWDFVDAPLAYQAFVGRQLRQEGLQARWVLPLERFVELGAEVGNGAAFPGNERNRNGAGSLLLSAHTGGDVGLSHSWRAGVSWLRTRAENREWDSTDPLDEANTLKNSFTGRSSLWVVDGVWKWAPNGNAKSTNLKLQGEYFRRQEKGTVAYDTANLNQADAYRSGQSGWYLQGAYQFMPAWRVGLRHDQLDSGRADFGLNTEWLGQERSKPRRDSVMLDWSPSEFSRWRLQLSNDRSRVEGSGDRQIFLQYQMSLGAHGAHGF